MYQSNQRFNIPPPGDLNLACSNSLLLGKKAVQMPHQLVLKYLSSKTNFVLNQTLYTLFRESYMYAVMTPSNFFWRPFWKSYSLTKAKFYLVNLTNPAKTKKISRRITSEEEINPVQIPPSPGMMHTQMPGACPGRGCWRFNFTST